MATHITVPGFVKEAKAIMARGLPLVEQQELIGEHLKELAKRDDLTRYAMSLGPTDANTHSYLLWREQPYTVLTLAQFDPGYLSPVHDHGDFWVVACGYRGVDRWDMYERLDDGSRPGFADLKMVDQIYVAPGKAIWMPEPPRAIHSHNNTTTGLNMLLIFTAATPQTPEQRLIFDVENQRCWPSPWDMSQRKGGDYPPVPLQREMALAGAPAPARPGLFTRLRGYVDGRGRIGACPACMAMALG